MIYAILSVVLGGLIGFVSFKRHLRKEWNSDFDKFNVYGSLYMSIFWVILGIIALLTLIFE